MKGQISRESYNADRRYSGVYQQQGRMLTDADWNELNEIVKQRLDDALYDVVLSGAPRDRGVEILAPAAGAAALRISGTHVYADGVKGVVAHDPGAPASADWFPIDEQADFPSWNYPPTSPAVATVVYADIWERAVLFSEDGSLLDPGLHGADTCFRTQTMAQIKWAAAADLADPEDPYLNQQIGTAPLTVILRAKRATADPCDPCADEVELESRVGNYLFRLEAHDVEGPPQAPTRLRLKWSTENAAEHYAAASVPTEFASGSWIWEFYSEAADKHLGYHPTRGKRADVSDWSPTRGELRETFPDLPPGDFVRRWDGYAVLDIAADGSVSLASESGVVLGMDRGIRLTLSSGNEPGAVAISGGVVTINLDSLKLALHIGAKSFLAGDYWLAVVREREHEAGDTVLDAATPTGIRHHYVTLARVTAGGTMESPSAATQRRLNFPPLTDIMAADVGFEVPCNSSIYQGLVPGTLTTVKDALGLLCDVRADQITYTTGACAYIGGYYGGAAKVTVQQAIDALCARTSEEDCCCVSLAPGQDLAAKIMELSRQGKLHICLCLKAGDHVLTGLFDSMDPRTTIHISGCGRDCTKLTLQSDLAIFQIASLTIHGVAIESVVTDAKIGFTRLLAIDVGAITLDSISFRGIATFTSPLIDLKATSRILLRDNVMRSFLIIVEAQPDTERWKGWVKAAGPIGDLLETAQTVDTPDFTSDARTLSDEIAASPERIQTTKITLGKARVLLDGAKTGRALIAAEATPAMLEALSLPQPRVSAAMLKVFLDVRDLLVLPALAIVIEDAAADVMMDHNDIYGTVSFYGEPRTITMDQDIAVLSKTQSLPMTDTGRTLDLRDNIITLVESSADQTATPTTVTTKDVFARLFAVANTFTASGHRFMARRCTWSCNRFESGVNNHAFAYVLCQNASLAATAGAGDNEGDAAPRLWVFTNPRGRVLHSSTLGMFVFT